VTKKDRKFSSYYELMSKDNKVIKKTLRRKKTTNTNGDRRRFYEEMKDKQWSSAARSPLGLGIIIKELLMQAFPKQKKVIEELMKEDRITLKQKAKIAYILDTIDEDLMKDLGIIYDIRNKFAHNFSGDFADDKVCKLVDKLSTTKGKTAKENSYKLYENAVKECCNKMADIYNKLREGNV
jgi:hypothetical protein